MIPPIDAKKGRFCGQPVSVANVQLIVKIVERCKNLTRTELANTVCECLDWTRPNGKLKTVECRQFLETLEDSGQLQLPKHMHTRSNRTRIVKTEAGDPQQVLNGKLGAFQPVSLSLVQDKEDHKHWRELIERYHYLGYRVPFGAHLRYFIYVSTPEPQLAGCLQFSSPAWRMAARDQWIGWDDEGRKRRLQHIINNSRFLLLPWISIKYLASHTLSLAARRVANDWMERYHTRPALLETLVDESRYTGGCYRASNWIELGSTTGRGRQDHNNERHGAAPKRIFVYPLRKKACQYLRSQG